jgi:hypothetical protein
VRPDDKHQRQLHPPPEKFPPRDAIGFISGKKINVKRKTARRMLGGPAREQPFGRDVSEEGR